MRGRPRRCAHCRAEIAGPEERTQLLRQRVHPGCLADADQDEYETAQW